MNFVVTANGTYLNLDQVCSASREMHLVGGQVLTLKFSIANDSAKVSLTGDDAAMVESALKIAVAEAAANVRIDHELEGILSSPPLAGEAQTAPMGSYVLPDRIEIPDQFAAMLEQAAPLIEKAGPIIKQGMAWFADTMEKFVVANGGKPRKDDPTGKIPGPKGKA